MNTLRKRRTLHLVHKPTQTPKVREAIRAAPNPQESAVIYRAQSRLTGAGKVGPVLSYSCALQVLDGIHESPDRTP